MNDSEKEKIKKKYKKGQGYYIIRNLIAGNILIIMAGFIVNVLSDYFIHQQIMTWARFFNTLAVTPIVLIIGGRREWQKIAYLHSEVLYEEEHGYPRRKSTFDRVFEKNRLGL